MNLNNSTSLTQPFYAPPNEGEDHADFDDDGTGPLFENPDGGDDEDNQFDLGALESENEDEINVDGEDFLTQLYQKGKDDKDDDQNDEDEDAGDSPEAQAALAQGIKDGIANLAIPESAIPDDFDPSNRKQLVTLLATVQRDTVQQTMRIMWDPIAAALKQTHVRMRQEWRQGIGESAEGMNRDALLNQIIPNHSDPGINDVVKSLMAQSKKRFPKATTREHIIATKKAMQGMGIKIGAPKSAQPKQQRGRRGSGSVLDNFARLPDAAFGPKPGASQQDRLRNRMRPGNK